MGLKINMVRPRQLYVKEDYSNINARWIIDSSVSRHVYNNVEWFDILINRGNLERLTVWIKMRINIKSVRRISVKVQIETTKIYII